MDPHATEVLQAQRTTPGQRESIRLWDIENLKNRITRLENYIPDTPAGMTARTQQLRELQYRLRQLETKH